MAMRGGLIDREDVDDCIDAFDKLDQNHSGTLTIEDCYFIPDRVAQLGRNKVLAELSKLESALNDVRHILHAWDMKPFCRLFGGFSI